MLDPESLTGTTPQGRTDDSSQTQHLRSCGTDWLLWLRHRRRPLPGESPSRMTVVVSCVLWSVLALLIGVIAGLSAALFLWALEVVTRQYAQAPSFLWGLPLVGFAVGWVYHRYGGAANGGSEAVVEQVQRPTAQLPWQMAPLVLLGTLITHLCGGSVGREGTAIQMSAALSDRWTGWLALRGHDRRTVLTMGISAGFAGLFGTPWAAAVFALELPRVDTAGSQRGMRTLVPRALAGLLAAFVADVTCRGTGVPHAHYPLGSVAAVGLIECGWAIVFGLLCGVVAFGYRRIHGTIKTLFRRWIAYPPLRPFFGGCAVVACVGLLGTTRYNGLGLPVIEQAFVEPVESTAFVWKSLLTALTLGAGFKGGEVTPLFFIGATFGNAVHTVVPLPLGLLTGMGFVAVFAGVTRTPWTCTLMGCELFGIQAAPFLAIGCFAAAYGLRLTQSLARLPVWR